MAVELKVQYCREICKILFETYGMPTVGPRNNLLVEDERQDDFKESVCVFSKQLYTVLTSYRSQIIHIKILYKIAFSAQLQGVPINMGNH